MVKRDLLSLMKDSSSFSAHFVAASTLAELARSDYENLINSHATLIADSRPLGRYLRLFDKDFVGGRGTDFIRDLIRNNPIRYFLLGSSEEVTSRMKLKLEKINIDSQCKGIINPPFRSDFSDELDDWVQQIIDSEAQVVWLGMGSPKQDRIAIELGHRSKVPIFAIGAAFDFIAGTKHEAPVFFRILYLEWLFRMMSEPKRLWKRYLFGNIRFLILVFLDFNFKMGRASANFLRKNR
jgi:N-acetylglucosaminyldiphosphoundecaprenol N-acetyl-beta-D-mannosaminyltransferase